MPRSSRRTGQIHDLSGQIHDLSSRERGCTRMNADCLSTKARRYRRFGAGGRRAFSWGNRTQWTTARRDASEVEAIVGRHLTNAPHAPHDGVVRRVISLAIATILALWLPAQSTRGFGAQPEDAPAGSVQTASLPTDGAAQTEQPSPTADPGPRMFAGTSASWQAQFGHDAAATNGWPPKLGASRACASAPAVSRRPHRSHATRTFPLLI